MQGPLRSISVFNPFKAVFENKEHTHLYKYASLNFIKDISLFLLAKLLRKIYG